MKKLSGILGFLLILVFAGAGFAVQFDPIPEGINIVVLVKNHSNLPLASLLEKAPLPKEAKDKIDALINETAFNPLRDVAQVQVMVKKAEERRNDEVVIVLTGKFDKEKIPAFLKKINLPIDETKIGEQPYWVSKDGKGGLVIFDSEKAALGKPEAVKGFIETRAGKAPSAAFDSLKSMTNEKAYVTLLVGGAEFLKNEMAKNKEKRERRRKANDDMPHARNQVRTWLEDYLTGDVAPQGLFANILDDKIEAKLLYDRGESKGNFAHLLIEISDPKIKIDAIFQEFLKILPELKPPVKE